MSKRVMTIVVEFPDGPLPSELYSHLNDDVPLYGGTVVCLSKGHAPERADSFEYAEFTCPKCVERLDIDIEDIEKAEMTPDKRVVECSGCRMAMVMNPSVE